MLQDTITETPQTASETVDAIKSLSLDDFINQLAHDLVRFAFHLAIAILVFYLGKFIIKRIYRFIGNIMVNRNVDPSLTTFVLSTVNIILYFILIVTVIGILGIETSSFLALFASAGVAVGMALSGTLQNFAGGVLILLLKPYKVGDYIEAQGYAGTVTAIQIFNTLISTPDNKAIIIPNGPLSTSSINNWSSRSHRRVSWTVSISYGDSVAEAREVIMGILALEPRILQVTPQEQIDDPEELENIVSHQKPSLWARIFGRANKVKAAIKKRDEERQARIKALFATPDYKPTVVVSEMGASSVDLSVRAWVKTPDYWGVFYDINERIYTELPLKSKVSFPFPQLDVHLTNQAANGDNS